MSKPVRVAAPAAKEVRQAQTWYEAQVPGLGDRLVAAIDRVLIEIGENPRRFAVVHRDVRRVFARPFPYGIFYREMAEVVRVIAIVHLHRDPATWQRRH